MKVTQDESNRCFCHPSKVTECECELICVLQTLLSFEKRIEVNNPANEMLFLHT